MVALRLKELPTLFNRSFHNRVVIFREGYVGPVRLEEILVDVKAGAKGFQSRRRASRGDRDAAVEQLSRLGKRDQ